MLKSGAQCAFSLNEFMPRYLFSREDLAFRFKVTRGKRKGPISVATTEMKQV
jgi:hypothetical protein